MTTFTYTEISGPTYECECCGCYSADGIDVSVDGTLVWRKYSDGHMYGDQTEEALVSCILREWNATCLRTIEAQYTEEARLAWDKKYPTSSIAKTVESWRERRQDALTMQAETLEQVQESCQNLPYDELLQIKMIALWVEACGGGRITVEETSYQEDDAAYQETEDD